METFVIVVDDGALGARVIGPFASAARASGRAFELFGALTFGNPYKWRVKPLENAIGGKR